MLRLKSALTRFVGLMLFGTQLLGCGRAAKNSSGGDATQGGAGNASGGGRICDGTMNLRLAIRTEDGEGNVPAQLHRELGASYLYVRGDCRFWVRNYQANPGWTPTRTGVLTSEQESQLVEDVAYDRFEELAELYPAGPGAVYDVYYDGKHPIWCQGGCYDGHPSAPEALQSASAAARFWWQRLWDDGETMLGPVRAIISSATGEDEGDPESCILQWDFDLDPSTIALPLVNDAAFAGTVEGVSSRIDDPNEANELRSWWLEYREDPACDVPSDGFAIPFTAPSDRKTVYGLWLRDAVPLENDRGLIPIPMP